MSRLPDHFLNLRAEATSSEEIAELLEFAANRVRLGHTCCEITGKPNPRGGFRITNIDAPDDEEFVESSQMRRFLEQPAPAGLCTEHGFEPNIGMTVIDVIGLDARLKANSSSRRNKPEILHQDMPDGITPVYVDAMDFAPMQTDVRAMLRRAPSLTEYYAVACCAAKGHGFEDASWIFTSMTPVMPVQELEMMFEFLRDTTRPNPNTRHALLSHENAIFIQDARKHRLPVRVVYNLS